MDINQKLEENRLKSDDKLRKALESRTGNPNEVLRIGDRDPQTGKYQTIHPTGTTTTDGVKTFAGATNQQAVRSLNPVGGGARALDAKNFIPPKTPAPAKKKAKTVTEVQAGLYLINHIHRACNDYRNSAEFQIRLREPAPANVQITLKITNGGDPTRITEFGRDTRKKVFLIHPELESIFAFSYPAFTPYVDFEPDVEFTVTIPEGKDRLYLYIPPREHIGSGILDRPELSPNFFVEIVEKDGVSISTDETLTWEAKIQIWIVQYVIFETVHWYSDEHPYTFTYGSDHSPESDGRIGGIDITDIAGYNEFVANPKGWYFQNSAIAPSTTTLDDRVLYFLNGEVDNPYTEVNRTPTAPDRYRPARLEPVSRIVNLEDLINQELTDEVTITPQITVALTAPANSGDAVSLGTLSIDLTSYPSTIAVTGGDSSSGLTECSAISWLYIWSDINFKDLITDRYSPSAQNIQNASQVYFSGSGGFNNIDNWGVDGNYYFGGTPVDKKTTRIKRSVTPSGSYTSEQTLQSNGWYLAYSAIGRNFTSAEQIYYDWATLYPTVYYDYIGAGGVDPPLDHYGNIVVNQDYNSYPDLALLWSSNEQIGRPFLNYSDAGRPNNQDGTYVSYITNPYGGISYWVEYYGL